MQIALRVLSNGNLLKKQKEKIKNKKIKK